MPNETEPVDFQDATANGVEKNRVKTTIAKVYNNVVNVTVVTTVGGVTANLTAAGEEKITVTLTSGGTPRAFVTQLDLLEGDIVTALPDDFADLPTVLALHERNVETASKVLPANIEALVNAGREVIKLFDAS